MRLVRFGNIGAEKPGILLPDDTILDISSEINDYNEAFFAADGMAKVREVAEQQGIDNFPKISKDSVRIGAPIAQPGKIVCVGLNFIDHANELKITPTSEPVLFMKASSSQTGPYDDIEIPPKSIKTDWEVELAFVISKRAKNVEEENALDYVAGLMLMNDISEREFQQERYGQWVKGKSYDTFAPMGPFLVTIDEAGDFDNLSMWLDVNGKRCQKSSTLNMIFKVPYLVSYISKFMTLLPGDVVSTGTPPGVGVGMTPQMFLKDGDTIEFGVEKLGVQKHLCKLL